MSARARPTSSPRRPSSSSTTRTARRRVWTRGDDTPATSDWGAFVAEAQRLRQRGGSVAVLAEPTASPSVRALRDRYVAATGARWITLSPHIEDAQALGTQQALGQPARPFARFSDADVIVSFDADFLGGDDPNSVSNNREFAASRRVDERGSMSRFYAVESTMTLTGGMADHRRAVKASAVPYVAAAIAQGLGVATGARSRSSAATPSRSSTPSSRTSGPPAGARRSSPATPSRPRSTRSSPPSTASSEAAWSSTSPSATGRPRRSAPNWRRSSAT